MPLFAVVLLPKLPQPKPQPRPQPNPKPQGARWNRGCCVVALVARADCCARLIQVGVPVPCCSPPTKAAQPARIEFDTGCCDVVGRPRSDCCARRMQYGGSRPLLFAFQGCSSGSSAARARVLYDACLAERAVLQLGLVVFDLPRPFPSAAASAGRPLPPRSACVPRRRSCTPRHETTAARR